MAMVDVYEGLPFTEMVVNSSSTVQANALLRLGVFVPVKRNYKANELAASSAHVIDASEEFRTLKFVEKEGYRNVTVTGLRLNFDTDFKVWCGIIQAFYESGYQSEVSVKFTDFAKLCGFPTKRIDKALRARLDDSFLRLRNQAIQFRESSHDKGKSYTGGLISSIAYDTEEDIVTLVPDPKLWELYKIDHQVLLQLKALSKLPRQEVAQCLYVYLSALPERPYPISFTRLRERMQLTSSKVAEQNRSISSAINKLISIGYLQGSVVKKGSDRYLLVEKRCPKLSLRGLPK
ncbi:TPA: RepB family plasmid replication initiator protein [Vibrio vulnificus]